MARCYQLVGVPGSGKSTWVKSQEWMQDCVIVSTDAYVERFAARMGKTYSQVFDTVMPRAVRLMMRRVRWAQDRNKDIVWDQTSTTVPSRSRKFRALSNYAHVAIVLATPAGPELRRRLDSRPGRHIPRRVVNSMIHAFEPPTEDEGFEEIWHAQ